MFGFPCIVQLAAVMSLTLIAGHDASVEVPLSPLLPKSIVPGSYSRDQFWEMINQVKSTVMNMSPTSRNALHGIEDRCWFETDGAIRRKEQRFWNMIWSNTYTLDSAPSVSNDIRKLNEYHTTYMLLKPGDEPNIVILGTSGPELRVLTSTDSPIVGVIQRWRMNTQSKDKDSKNLEELSQLVTFTCK